MVLYYQMRKIQIFPLVFFWILNTNPKKQEKSKNPKIQKSKTFRDFPKSFGFLDFFDFCIFHFWIFMKIVYLFSA